MKKKQYISPALSVYQVSTCEVICGSGNQVETVPTNSSGGPSGSSNGFFGGDASERRSGWDDYEGR